MRTTGQRFVRPEFPLLIALYAIHFAVWIPVALRLSTRASFQFLLVLAPVAVCLGISAIWLGVSYTLRKNNPSQEGPSFLPMAHLCLIAFTVLCLVIGVFGILGVT